MQKGTFPDSRRESNHFISDLTFFLKTVDGRSSKGHALLDLSDSQRRVQTLGARPGAVENGVTAVKTHAIVERVLAGGGSLVTRIGDPAV